MFADCYNCLLTYCHLLTEIELQLRVFCIDLVEVAMIADFVF